VSQLLQPSAGFRTELSTLAQRVKQVWQLVRTPQRLALCAATMIMAVAAWLNAEIPVILGDLATGMELAKKAGRSWGLRESSSFLITLAVYFIAREALQVFRKYLVHNTTTRVEKSVGIALVSHLLRLDLSHLRQDRVGTLHGRIRRSVEGFVKLLHLGFMDFLPAVLTAAVALIVAIHRQIVLGFLMAGVIPIASYIVFRQIVSQKGIRLEILRSKDDVDGTVVEQLGGIEYVRAAHTYEQEVAKIEDIAEIVRAKEIRHHIMMSLYDFWKAGNEGIFFICIVGVSIALAAQAKINTGDIIIFSMLFASVLTPLREVHRIIDEAHESSLRVGQLVEMMSEPVDRSFSINVSEEPRLSAGEPLIVASGLEATYTGDDGQIKHALNGLTLSIRHGEKIGIVGRSGCGKSTFIRLLMRLNHPSAGVLSFGGVPIDLFSRESIGRLIGYVGQEPFLFTGSIRENIAYGYPGATFDEVQKAAKLAFIHDDIMAMAGGYEAQVTERGKNLSGGQIQRIALARIFLKGTPVLILDEATSALDNISEHGIQQAIGIGKSDRTVIVVAHRLSTIRDTDRIMVFDNGRVVETGKYDELVEKGGVFSSLVHSIDVGEKSQFGSDNLALDPS
jgi:ATP-binding cassette, subfamily B, bacterial